MKTVLGPRASSILYDLLMTHGSKRPFLLPANVCAIVPLTFLKAKAPFEFVDISPSTLHMDLGNVQRLLASRKGAYGGVLYVHTYGDPFTPNQFFGEIKHQNPDMLVVDDRCPCVPDLEPDASVIADAVLYSTGYAKIVDQGFGGYAFLQEGVPWQHRSLPYQHQALEVLDGNYKRSIADRQPFQYADTDWLQTDVELPTWPDFSARLRSTLKLSLEHRSCLNTVYDALIPAEIRLPASYQLWRYNIRVKDNRGVLAAIFDAGLFASAHYASLTGVFGAGAGSNASELADHVINLFNDHHYTLDMAERTAQIVLRSL